MNEFWKRFWVKIGRDGLIMFGAAFLVWANSDLIPSGRRALALYFALEKLKDGDKDVIDGSIT